MQVNTDGVPYAPACASSSRIGIAITTHNRADVLNRALAQHLQFLPAGALVVVIDDGSKPAAVGERVPPILLYPGVKTAGDGRGRR